MSSCRRGFFTHRFDSNASEPSCRGRDSLGLLSRREKERKASLDALAKLAYSVGGGAPAPPPPPQARASSLPPARPKEAPKPAQPAAKRADPEAERRRRQQMESRAAKLEEDRMLRERRAQQLHRNANLEWRGMSNDGIPTSIRRTGFDREEPSLKQKIGDILGDAKEKEGRAKARDRGRRQGGG